MENSKTPRPPSPDAIAAFVKVQRLFYGWKQDTLASLAGVSVSTVQRVERAKTVRKKQLEKLAVALKREPDVFTRVIIPLSPEQALEALRRDSDWLEGRVPVSVEPLRKESQVRALSETHMFVADCDLEVAEEAVAELREWFELASFIRAEHAGLIGTVDKTPLRPFYQGLLDSVRRLEAECRAVCLAGVYVVETSHGPMKVAAIALRSRENDPAAASMKTLWADGSVDMAQVDWNFVP